MLGMNFSSDPVADAERREVDYEKWLKTKKRMLWMQGVHQ